MGDIIVREVELSKDRLGVEEVERGCSVGPSGKLSIFTDLLGDPLCRVRYSPSFLMLVALIGHQIVGIIRGSIKTVTCGNKLSRTSSYDSITPLYTKLAYILGLRVSPSHRRMGIGVKLVRRMEEWFRDNGAEYSYIATDNDNHASVNLFTGKCGYSKFRTPAILVNPVFAGHRLPLSRRVSVVSLSPSHAESLYRRRFAAATEFFPRDIDAVLNNRLSLGTFLAAPQGYTWPGPEGFLSDPPGSWALLSVWNCKDVFTLEVRGASRVRRALAGTSRLVDRAFPFLRVPSVPQLFRPFGMAFLYGIAGEGPRAANMVNALCKHAHNVAREVGCGVVAAEVATRDPLRLGIPHWKKLSCAEDLWCIKRLDEDYSDGALGDWTKAPPGSSIFVDPREF